MPFALPRRPLTPTDQAQKKALPHLPTLSTITTNRINNKVPNNKATKNTTATAHSSISCCYRLITYINIQWIPHLPVKQFYPRNTGHSRYHIVDLYPSNFKCYHTKQKESSRGFSPKKPSIPPNSVFITVQPNTRKIPDSLGKTHGQK